MDGFMNVLNVINYLDYRPKYEKEKCVKSISHKAGCTVCKDICPQNAITINKRSITIEDNCNSCNECVSYCPTNCLIDTGKKFIAGNKKIYVLCQNHKLEEEPDHRFKVNCLNFISTKVLLNIYKAGYREIHTNLDKCKDCERNNNLLNELNKTNEILTKLDKPLMTVTNESVEDLITGVEEIENNKSNTEVGRRGFFKHLAKELYSKTYEVAPPSSREQFWSTEVDIISSWQIDREDKLSLYNILIDDNKCIQCEACIKLCPQKVWIINDDIKEQRLDLCNGCRLCKDICPGKAIEISQEIKIAKRVNSKKSAKSCVKCNKEFLTYKDNTNICPTCIGKEIFK